LRSFRNTGADTGYSRAFSVILRPQAAPASEGSSEDGTTNVTATVESIELILHIPSTYPDDIPKTELRESGFLNTE
jgi:hypothetical protein